MYCDFKVLKVVFGQKCANWLQNFMQALLLRKSSSLKMAMKLREVTNET